MRLPTLTYFDIRGRAEPVRMIFEEMGAGYEDRRIRGEEWPALKPETPFGGLPMLELDGRTLVQSHAIYRYLARIHGLYGATAEEQIRCDIAIEALRDAKDQLGSAFWSPDFEASRSSFVDGELAERLTGLVRFFELEAGDGHWVGSQLSLADFLAFAYLDDLEGHFPGVLTDFPSLAGFRHAFSERPRTHAYLRSGRRPAALQYGPQGRIHPAGPDGAP